MERDDPKKPVRILQVLGRLDRGGAETMIMNLYRYMDRSRIQFDFVIHTKDCCDYSGDVLRLGGRIYSMKPFTVSTAGSYSRQWRQFFAAHREYHVIHGHMRSTASLYLKEARKAGLVTIVHSHNTSSGKGISAMVKNVLQYPLRYMADYLFACSLKAGIWLYGEKACRKDRFRILLNGIEPEKFRFMEDIRNRKRQEMLAEDKRVFLHIGRLEPQKNHVFLLEIFEKIYREHEEAQLWLCGTGILEETVRKQADMMKLDGAVRFLGVRSDIPEIMQASDGMIFPSLFEGLPVTLIEAQASGLPVLMSDTVTDEVVITDLIAKESLRTPAGVWGRKAWEISGRLHTDRCAQIIAGGYSVADEAKKLQAFYEMADKDQNA